MDKLALLQELTASSMTTQIVLLAIGSLLLHFLFVHSRNTFPGVPVHGRRGHWEPTFLPQSRFAVQAREIISSGYEKFKDRPFVVKRNDVDIMIMPNKYLEELRLVPSAKLNATRAQAENLQYKWTYSASITESDLHIRVIKNKLATELYKYLDVAKTELDYAWSIDVPSSREWREVEIQPMLHMLVARMSARVFMGHPTCRDKEWLKLTIGFSIDMFTAAFTLRMFPLWTYPIVAHLIPARYRLKKYLRSAERVIQPLKESHADATKRRSLGQKVDVQDTLLNWTMDHGTEDENRIDKMSARQMLLTLASIHTTSTAATDVLLDLCAHPEWFPVLQEEIDSTTADLGPIGSTSESVVKQWLTRLEKLDSFLVESQRRHPPLLLSPQRVAVEALMLKDGTYIPKGSKICWAGYDHINDPSITHNPDIFDPMRSYNKRHASPQYRNKYLAGQTSPDNLVFGYGNQACPGRAFAVGEIKLILARLVSQYDFQFPEHIRTRPASKYADENVFPDPSVNLMMKIRGGGDD
ncbi:cytochrome P450 [Nemania sp. NC0429]|nr:cytochrome P450 [Nemania sp. NC0429]